MHIKIKDLYLYLTQNKLPSSKSAICKVEVLAEKHNIRFIVIQTGHNSRNGNCIISYTRNVCRQDNYTLPFKSVCGTPRCDKNLLDDSQQILYTRPCALFVSLHIGCHICQLSRKDKIPIKQLQARINLNYRPLSRLSMDLKVIPRSHKGHKFILCINDEVTNYLITVSIYHSRSEEIRDALIENIISKDGIPEYIIMDQDSTSMSTLMNYLFKRLTIKIKTVAPYNHQSLQSEHEIKSYQ